MKFILDYCKGILIGCGAGFKHFFIDKNFVSIQNA